MAKVQLRRLQIMNRSPLKFFLLVFALSIPIWLIGAMAERGLPPPMNLPVSALQAFCPLIAALILVYREDKLGGVRRLLKRVFDYRKGGSRVGTPFVRRGSHARFSTPAVSKSLEIGCGTPCATG